jgi:transposase
LRDVTRYRRSLVRDRTREKQRLEKLLEDAQIKLGSIIRDLHGASGRQMLEAMIAGERDPNLLVSHQSSFVTRRALFGVSDSTSVL